MILAETMVPPDCPCLGSPVSAPTDRLEAHGHKKQFSTRLKEQWTPVCFGILQSCLDHHQYIHSAQTQTDSDGAGHLCGPVWPSVCNLIITLPVLGNTIQEGHREIEIFPQYFYSFLGHYVKCQQQIVCLLMLFKTAVSTLADQAWLCGSHISFSANEFRYMKLFMNS